MDGTACLGCEADLSRFRVVVDIETDRELGRICHSCLSAAFGELIADPRWCKDEGCAVCDRDAFYGVPDVKLCRETRGAGYTTSRYEYSLDDSTVLLCDEHLTQLSTDVSDSQPVIADGGV